MIKNRKKLFINQSGFTLIEISIAILMLATSLVVLIGLEQSSMQRAINDKDRRVALSVARRIMSDIEIKKITIDIDQKKEDKLLNFLKQNDFELEDDDIEKKNLEKFSIVLQASSPPLAGIEQDNLIKLIELTISWGETNREKLYLIRYIEPDENL